MKVNLVKGEKYKVVLPDGTEFIIDEEKVCFKSSSEKCFRINKAVMEALIHYAVHHGYKVEKLEVSK